MKSIKQIAHSSLHNLGEATTRRLIKQFANKYHLVYFGHVDPREDEYELVRGLTVSTTHTDSHYTVGSYNGHDIIVVERRNILTFPGKPDSNYRWIIMQVDLTRSGLPHVFIDSHHHDAVFYANAFLGQHNMLDMTSYLNDVSAVFGQYCRLYANPAMYAAMRALLRAQVVETIAQQFRQFDYEFFDDRVLVYASNRTVTPQLLEEMLQIGAWLAEAFNAAVLP